MEPTILGIDVAKNDFHASLLFEDGKTASRSFPNVVRGFEPVGQVAEQPKGGTRSCLPRGDWRLGARHWPWTSTSVVML